MPDQEKEIFDMVDFSTGSPENVRLFGDAFKKSRFSQRTICIVLWTGGTLLTVVTLIVIILNHSSTTSSSSTIIEQNISDTNDASISFNGTSSSTIVGITTVHNLLKDAIAKAKEDLEKQRNFEDILKARGFVSSPGTAPYLHHRMAGNISKFLPIAARGKYLENVFRDLKTSVSRSLFLDVIAIPLENCSENLITCSRQAVYRTFDGSCNNLKIPSWGMMGTIFPRLMEPVYDDGISSIRKSLEGDALPSPRLVSSTIHRMLYKTNSKYSHLMMTWGKLIAHDISKTATAEITNGNTVIRCCQEDSNLGNDFPLHPECLPISIPIDDPFYSQFNQTCMEFVRSLQGFASKCIPAPRQQLNLVTSFIDGSAIYGSSEEEMRQLRTFQNGLLKTTTVRHQSFLPYDEQNCGKGSENFCYLSGDARVNQQPLLTSLHTLWMRQHNLLATTLEMINSHWSDEKIFQETRKIIGAMIQHITYNEFLPQLLGPNITSLYKLHLKKEGFSYDYDDSLQPSVLNEFAAAAFRFGHSMVQGMWEMKNSEDLQSLKDLYFHPQLLQDGYMNSLVAGALGQNSKSVNRFISPQLTNYLFQSSNRGFGLDLAAINIQRGRDHGLASYNHWRKICLLQQFRSMDEMKQSMDDEAVDKFKFIYKNVEDIDLFSAGLSERPQNGAILGPVFACLIGIQFSRLKLGDRYWYENGNFTHSFTLDQLQEIRRSSLSRVICDNVGEINKIQLYPMITSGRSNPTLPCNSRQIPRMDLAKWVEMN